MDTNERKPVNDSEQLDAIAVSSPERIDAFGAEATELPEPDDHRLYDDLLPSSTELFVRTNDEDVESAAELAVPARDRLIQPEDDRPYDGGMTAVREEDAVQGGTILGWIALLLGISSLFVWPSVMGPAAVVVGFMAYVRGRKALGVWSMVLGFIAFITFLAMLAYYR